MERASLYEYLSRISRLLMAEERSGREALPAVQIAALHYLNRCNRYSDTPASVADYLAATKGTVSQTLRALENKGLIERHADANDGRVVHLAPTRAGKQLLRAEIPPPAFRAAEAELGNDDRDQLRELLETLLRGMQRSGQISLFGVCRTCSHFRRLGENRFQCGLTEERLTPADSEKICREHAA